ncbi:hypothetical protein [Lysinibacillus sp. RC79]|uniref:hypothetical protein n=1 Tax=Lysinibacillus sp. RC79 TaxID=3156296 RepID=UPI003517CB4F
MFDKNLFQPIIDFQKQIIEMTSQIDKIIQENLPEIELPEITLPKLNYEEIRTNIKHNSRYGWTLTGGMSLGHYLDKVLRNMNQDQLDEYFFQYYTTNDNSFFKETETHLLKFIEPHRKELLKDCLDNFVNNNYRIAIPSLMTLIEGEVTDILETKDYGWKLNDKMSNAAKDEEEKFYQITTYSTYDYLRRELYKPHKFDTKRRNMINRHWVLHGRDNPNVWTKYDGLRLINVLSSLQFIKEYKD